MKSECGKYYDLIATKYEELKANCSFAYHQATGECLNEDVFHDTLIKCMETLTNETIEQMDEKALMNYTYIAYKTNMFREKQYYRVKNVVPLTTKHDQPTNTYSLSENWDISEKIQNYIIQKFGQELFEQYCAWIIDEKSISEIENTYNTTGLYYKFKKLKESIIKKFGQNILN